MVNCSSLASISGRPAYLVRRRDPPSQGWKQPTAEWIANQLTAACGWEQLPRYLIRDRDACYGDIFVRRVRSLGMRDHLCTFTLAERICGAFDRLDSPGMPRPCCCGRRAAPAPNLHVLHGVLQRRPNASLIR